jgi:hypothetical protein
VLKRDSFVERNGLELKGQFVGQTAPTVKQAIGDAMGGTLFIDEAPAIVESGGDSYSGECLRTLLTEVENNRTNLMVVLAGYKNKMDNLLATDEGLPRRFQRRLHLEDYTPAEMAQICNRVAAKRFSLAIDPQVMQAITAHLSCEYSNGPCPAQSPIPCGNCHRVRSQNGGLAVYMVEAAFKQLAQRIVRTGMLRNDPARLQLTVEDFGIALTSPRPVRPSRLIALSADEARQLQQEVKRFIRERLSDADITLLTQLGSSHLASAMAALRPSSSHVL